LPTSFEAKDPPAVPAAAPAPPRAAAARAGALHRLYRRLAVSQSPLARTLRRLRTLPRRLSLPAPKLIFGPLLALVLFSRAMYAFLMRLLICEPLFKARCAEYGKGVHTGEFLHWVRGPGRIVLGDYVLVDGRCSITFAARFCDAPTLSIGDHSGVGNNCVFTVAREISIGRHCRIATDVWMFDSPGHPADPVARLAGAPVSADEVRPVRVCDNVWIGRRSIIYPGVTLGEGCTVSAGSVVISDVPPYTVVAGNPARKVLALARPAPADDNGNPSGGGNGHV
jgi:acetyltransferase-like isoleucine patch superfamily enzyme